MDICNILSHLALSLTLKRVLRNRRLHAIENGKPIMEQLFKYDVNSKTTSVSRRGCGQNPSIGVNDQVNLLSVINDVPKLNPALSASMIGNIQAATKRKSSIKTATHTRHLLEKDTEARPIKKSKTSEKPIEATSNTRKKTGLPTPSKTSGRRIEYKIDDTGIQSQSTAKQTSNASDGVEDITKIIREKLKNLPSLG